MLVRKYAALVFLLPTSTAFLATSCSKPAIQESVLADIDNPSPSRVAECGVERYEASRRPECGVESYNSARSSNCPAELYIQRTHSHCPGYIPGAEYKRERRACDSNDITLSVDTFDQGNKPPYNIYYCKMKDVVQTCRLPEFGVEVYQSCQRPEFGVQAYKSCEDQSRPVYASCTVRSRATIETYIGETERSVQVIGPMLISSQSHLFKSAVSEAALACLIQRYEGDPIAEGIISDLKIQFPIFIGRPYSPELATNCAQAMSDAAQVKVDCSANPNVQVCKDKTSFDSAVKWLTENRDRTIRLQSDPTVKLNADLSQRLSSLNASIAGFLK